MGAADGATRAFAIRYHDRANSHATPECLITELSPNKVKGLTAGPVDAVNAGRARNEADEPDA
jgi:hypothetical protein